MKVRMLSGRSCIHSGLYLPKAHRCHLVQLAQISVTIATDKSPTLQNKLAPETATCHSVP